MNKKIIISIIIILLLILIYWMLGLMGYVPIRHCDSAMGPNGPVHFCEWYKGSRIY